MEVGFSPDSFWRTTPREFHAAIDGYNRRVISERNLLVVGGYYSAMFNRAKTFPRDVSKYLVEPDGVKKTSQVPAGEGLRAWASFFQIQNKQKS